MSTPSIATWFTAGSPIRSAGNPSLIIGGTHLLDEFIHLLQELGGPITVTVVAPFLDAPSVEYLCSAIDGRTSLVDLQLITAPGTAAGMAVQTLATLKWRSCRVISRRGLHSKVYIARGADGRSTAMIGSHNLTRAGRRKNFEVGVLLVGIDQQATQTIEDIEQSVHALRDGATIEYDSWHPSFAASDAA